MIESPTRPVALWAPDVRWKIRDDGAIVVSQADELGSYPDRLSDVIRHWAKHRPTRRWMVERDADGVWQGTDYATLWDRIRRIGQALLDLGLSVERPLIILSENSVGHALVSYGAQYAGIPAAAIAPAYSTSASPLRKLASVRDQITPGAVYVEDSGPFARALNEVFPDLPVIGRGGIGLAITWDALLATEPRDDVDRANAATGPDSVAKFLFTSGTTGMPKAVVQTQRMLCANAEQITDCFAFMREEPPVMLDWSPWNHVAGGNMMCHLTLYNGGTFYIDGGRPTRAHFAKTIANLRDIQPNWYWNVPFGFEMLAEAMAEDKELAEIFFSKLRLMYYAGAAMARHTWDALDALSIRTTGQRILLSTGLGSTETAPFALSNTDWKAESGNLGVPAKGVELKLVPVGDKWEARLKGPNITPGYWRNPELTAEAFDEEGYYRLGDALRFAEPGNPAKGFFFDGRMAENFKMSTGTWVAVGPLRARIIDALGGLIRDVVITGEGEDRLGALLLPFRPAIEKFVPAGAELPDAELFAHPMFLQELRRRLHAYNAPNLGMSLRIGRAMVFDTALSLEAGEITDKGAINQRLLRDRYGEILARLSLDDPALIVAGGC